MKRLSILGAIFMLVSLIVFARPYLVVDPVKPTVTVNQRILFLNGAGLYRRYFFSVYKVYLYLENPTQNSLGILESLETKYAEMHFMRNVSANSIKNAWLETFQDQCAQNCETLKPKLEEMLNRIPDMKKDEYFQFTFLPDKMIVGKIGLENIIIEGSDLGRFQLSVWLGDDPPSKSFKDGLLGVSKITNPLELIRTNIKN